MSATIQKIHKKNDFGYSILIKSSTTVNQTYSTAVNQTHSRLGINSVLRRNQTRSRLETKLCPAGIKSVSSWNQSRAQTDLKPFHGCESNSFQSCKLDLFQRRAQNHYFIICLTVSTGEQSKYR